MGTFPMELKDADADDDAQDLGERTRMIADLFKQDAGVLW